MTVHNPVPPPAQAEPPSWVPAPEEALEASPRALLDILVAFPTVSSRGNRALLNWVDAWLRAHGAETGQVLDETGAKASLYAHVGPAEAGGVILSGHVDVVPVEGQDWTTDPFTVAERDGRLYGRGTCDMKGFVALALWAMGQAAHRPLARPLQIALTRDEEIGCIAAPGLLAEMAARGVPLASEAIIGEPTNMACVTGHKGGFGYWIDAHGYEVHSSIMHTGVNAIMEAARVIQWANDRNAANAAEPPTDLAAAFEPPWTTVHTGRIEGGTAHNITAGHCAFGVDFRVVPGEDMDGWRRALLAELDRVEAGMRAVAPTARLDRADRFHVPALRPEEAGAAEGLVRGITGDNGLHVVSYGTEAGQFQEAGYSAVVCGPGDIAQAHQPDEFLSTAQFAAGQRFLEKLLDRISL
ncbi:MAG: acetylornithine deacetylase [Pseudomonadota bacterium]